MIRFTYFDDCLRFSLFFNNPNHEGCLLVMVSLLLLGVSLFLWQGGSPWRRAVSCVLMLFDLFSLRLLALTYSRGAYVSFIASLVFLGCLAVCFCLKFKLLKLRLLSCCPVLMIVFFLLLAVMPSGMKRARGIVAFENDRSVLNRIDLWKGGAVIASRHIFSGDGVGSATLTFSFWLEPLVRKFEYTDFISDTITVSAGYGLLALFSTLSLYLLTFIIPIGYVFRTGKSDWILPIALVPFSYLVSGLFTCCLERWELICFSLIVSLPLAVYSLRQRGVCLAKSSLCLSVCMSLLTCILIFAVGKYVESSWSYKLVELPVMDDGNCTKLKNKVMIANVSHTQAHANTIIFTESPNEDFCRFAPVAFENDSNLLVYQCEGGRASVDEIREYFAEFRQDLSNTVVIGLGPAAGNALFAAMSGFEGSSLIKEAIFWELDLDIEDAELSPVPGALECPVVIFKESDQYFKYWPRRRERLLTSDGKPGVLMDEFRRSIHKE